MTTTRAPVGSKLRAAESTTTPKDEPRRAPTPRRAGGSPTPDLHAPAGADTHPTKARPIPEASAPGGTDRHPVLDALIGSAVGEVVPGRAAEHAAMPREQALSDLELLYTMAEALDDLESVRKAMGNRMGQLTRSTEDKDGQVRGFGYSDDHPIVLQLGETLTELEASEKALVRKLERLFRWNPLYPWVKAQRGIGDKQAARLLAIIGDPYIRPELVRDDGTVIPEGPRTVSALWAYCGLHVLPADRSWYDAQVADVGGAPSSADPTTRGTHSSLASGSSPDQQDPDARVRRVGDGGDPGQNSADTRRSSAGVAPRRARGQRANWSTKAKTRAYLIAESCVKQLVKPCAKGDGDKWAAHVDGCACSPYRLVYDARRRHTAVTHPEWTDGHAQADALRVTSKEILKDLWREAKRLHDTSTATDGSAIPNLETSQSRPDDPPPAEKVATSKSTPPGAGTPRPAVPRPTPIEDALDGLPLADSVTDSRRRSPGEGDDHPVPADAEPMPSTQAPGPGGS